MMHKVMRALGVLVLTASNASAHVPTVLPHDTSPYFTVGVPSPIEKSVAFYASLEYPGDVDTYGLRFGSDAFTNSVMLKDVRGIVHNLVVPAPSGRPGRLLHIGSLVPACQIYANVLPTIAVVGPVQDALPRYDATIALPAGVQIKDGEGVVFLQNRGQGPVWYEKFTYKSYFDQNQVDLIVTEAGEYRIYVWDSNNGVGDYVLESGQIETFGLPEILQTLSWVTHVIYDGEITSNLCKAQLQELDGRNPSIAKIISDYQTLFAK